MNNLCFKSRTFEEGLFFQITELRGLLAWHGLKMAVLCSTHYVTRTTGHTGKFLFMFLRPWAWYHYVVLPICFVISVQCMKLGSDSVDSNIPIFVESDSRYCVDITSTKDGKFITVNSNSRASSEEGTCLHHFCFIPFNCIWTSFCSYILHLGGCRFML